MPNWYEWQSNTRIMNNRQFVQELADRCQMDESQTSQTILNLIKVMENIWHEGDSISLSGFGVLEVRKKNERVSVNPVTGVRMLVPPKLVLSYKPSSLLKDKLK